MSFSVHITGRGAMTGDALHPDPAAVAHCDLCDRDVELVVGVAAARACRACLRQRLDAASIASYRLSEGLSEGGGALPWGKVTS